MKTIRFLPLSLALSISACGSPDGGDTGTGAGGTGGDDTGTSPDGGEGGGTGAGPAADWHRLLWGPESQDSMAMTIDASGRVVIAGSSRGLADLGEGASLPVGETALFVTVFNTDGSTAFTRGFAAANVTCTDVKTDPEGNIVVSGSFQGGPLQIGDTTLQPAGVIDGFTARLTPDGAPLWALSYSDPVYQLASGGALAVAEDGEIVNVANRGAELLVQRLSPGGQVLVEHHEGNISSPFSFFSAAKAAAVAPNGDVFVTGTFISGAVLGPMVSDDNGQKIFVARLDRANGLPIWAHAYGDPLAFYNNTGDALAVDAAGDVLVSGSFAGALDFGGGAVPGRVFVTKLAGADGAHLWSRGFGQEPSNTQIGLTPGGHAVLLSSLEVAAEIEGTPLPAGSYLAEISQDDGQLLHTRPLPEIGAVISETEHGFFGLGELAVGPGGDVAVMSSFFGAYPTSLGTFTSAGWSDVLVVHYAGF